MEAKEHGDQPDDQHNDADIAKSLPLWARYDNTIKTTACLLGVLLMWVGLIVLASELGISGEEKEKICRCANGQARACVSGRANRDIDVLLSQTSLLDNELNNIGVALNGYDVVQYSLQSSKQSGVLGCPEFAANLTSRVSKATDATVLYQVYTFWFASAENRDTFLDSPWSFVPRYGGFGAFRLAREAAHAKGWNARALGPPSDPINLWTLNNQSLYLFATPADLEAFHRISDTIIADADALWVSWYGSLQAGPVNSQCFAQTWHCCRQCVPPSAGSNSYQPVPMSPGTSRQCRPFNNVSACPA